MCEQQSYQPQNIKESTAILFIDCRIIKKGLAFICQPFVFFLIAYN